MQKNRSSLISFPEDQTPLAHLLNQPMTPRELKAALSKAGAHFFPEPDASKYVSTVKKRSGVEGVVYRNMSLASSAFGFQWSRWNSECGSTGKVVLQVAEGGGSGDKDQVSLGLGGHSIMNCQAIMFK